MKVPQFSPWIGEEEYKAIQSCFESNWITEGPKSKEFAEKLLKLIGSKYGVFAPNGTLAIYLGLRAIDIGPGDEVLVPDFTFLASGSAVEMCGATPVFVDVNKRNFHVDIQAAKKALTSKTKAVMPVHIYGAVCDMDEVMTFAKKNNLKVIEDAAEAIGVHWKGKHSGTFGDVGCFSFFADKTITTAEGGFVVTDSQVVYENLLYLRNQGRIDRGSFIHPRVGYNFRMTDIQNAVGLVQLSKLKEIIRRKEHIKGLYKKLLGKVKGITFFEPDKGSEWVPFRIGILTEHSHDLMSFMKTKDIEARTFFYPLHKQPAFSYLAKKGQDLGDSNFPNSVYGYENGLCLPTFPTLTDDQISYVCSAIKEFQGRDVFYKYYDAIYNQKDYSAETKMVLDLSSKFGLGKPSRILEIGAGTGNHTKHLAQVTKELVGVDNDERMLEVARKKLKKELLNGLRLINKTIDTLDEGTFDLALALFNVVTYLPDTKTLESFMKGVSDRLSKKGIFVFDCWNGAAALLDPPKSKKLQIMSGTKKINYTLSAETDFIKQKTLLSYDLEVLNGKSKEHGVMSFNQTLWMPREILSAVEKAGLELIFASPFMKPEMPLTQKDWKMMFCVRKP